MSVSEKTELELAKLKLSIQNATEREVAQKKIVELTELDISRDQKMIDACGNPNDSCAPASTFRSGTYTEKSQKLIFIYIGIMVVQQKLMVVIDLQNPQKDRCSSN